MSSYTIHVSSKTFSYLKRLGKLKDLKESFSKTINYIKSVLNNCIIPYEIIIFVNGNKLINLNNSGKTILDDFNEYLSKIVQNADSNEIDKMSLQELDEYCIKFTHLIKCIDKDIINFYLSSFNDFMVNISNDNEKSNILYDNSHKKFSEECEKMIIKKYTKSTKSIESKTDSDGFIEVKSKYKQSKSGQILKTINIQRSNIIKFRTTSENQWDLLNETEQYQLHKGLSLFNEEPPELKFKEVETLQNTNNCKKLKELLKKDKVDIRLVDKRTFFTQMSKIEKANFNSLSHCLYNRTIHQLYPNIFPENKWVSVKTPERNYKVLNLTSKNMMKLHRDFSDMEVDGMKWCNCTGVFLTDFNIPYDSGDEEEDSDYDIPNFM